MSSSKQKLSEKRYLQRFRDFCEDFPTGNVIDHEKPDFLIFNDKVKVGIELTQLFRPVTPGQLPMQEIESWQRRIHETAKAIYEANGGPNLYVNVIFNEHLNRKNLSVKFLAKCLAQIVTASNPDVGDDIRIENPYIDSDIFPEEFEVVFVHRYAKATSSLWAPINAAFVPTLEPSLLQLRIDEKNEKVSEYRKSCQDVWLLIVLDGFNLSSHMDIPAAVINHVFSIRFERAYLFANSDGNLIRLNQK